MLHVEHKRESFAEEIERLEYREMIKIQDYLCNVFNELIVGLNSRIFFKNDWLDQFKNLKNKHTAKKSDLDRGAERIIHHIYASIYKKPLSVPIGSDLMYETYNAVVHIDVKTISIENIGDYRNINLEKNQTSYSFDWFKAALPCMYTKIEQDGKVVEKICLTYAIYILHEIGSKNINSILIINIPNGLLKNLYGEIILAGKSGKKKPHNARFAYSKFIHYKTMPREHRVVFLCKSSSKTQRELIGFSKPELPVLIDYETCCETI